MDDLAKTLKHTDNDKQTNGTQTNGGHQVNGDSPVIAEMNGSLKPDDPSIHNEVNT